MVDLHLHTNYSDGIDTPKRLIDLAKEASLSVISITDHDNTQALPVALPLARAAGIELIPGIEMSAAKNGIEIHVLGYLLDLENPGLIAHIEKQKARRVGRVREMVKRLEEKAGVVIDAEEVLKLAGDGTAGRAHVAEILLRHGHIATRAEAFERYIGSKNPGFIPGSPVAPEPIIQLIRQAGGVPVLAHPVYLNRDELIDELVDDGLVGLEIYHSGHTPDLVQHYERIADRLKLIKTGGSDYHGVSREGAPVGTVKVPYSVVESLKEWRAHNRKTPNL